MWSCSLCPYRYLMDMTNYSKQFLNIYEKYHKFYYPAYFQTEFALKTNKLFQKLTKIIFSSYIFTSFKYLVTVYKNIVFFVSSTQGNKATEGAVI